MGMPNLPTNKTFTTLNKARIRVEKAIKELEAAQGQLGLELPEDYEGNYLVGLTFKALTGCYALAQTIKKEISDLDD